MESASILEHLGEFGTFQKVMFALVCTIHLFVGGHTLANVFLMGEPPHRCYVPGCDDASSLYSENFTSFAIPSINNEKGTSVPSSCSFYGRDKGNDLCEESLFNSSWIWPCQSYVWDKSDFKSTAVTEFNVVCDKSWDRAFSSSFFMVGYLVGSLGFGTISDRFGRKTVIMLASILFLFSSISTAFSVNFFMFTILRFLIAVSVCGLAQASYILVLEYVGTSKRLVCCCIIGTMFSFGELLLALSAFYVRNWRALELCISMPGVFLLSYYWFLPESLRWLISKGKHARAHETVVRAAKLNKVELPVEILSITHCIPINGDSFKESKSSPLDLIRTPRLRKWTLILFFIWTVNTMVYYGLALNAGHLYGDIYVNFSLMAIAEIPTLLVTTVALVYFGPRRILSVVMILGSIACGATVVIPEVVGWISLMFTLVARISTSSSFSIVYLFSSEIFPTVLRSTGIGLSSTFGRFGAIVAPIILQLGEIYHYLPMLIFAVALMVSGLLTLILPETFKQQLPDSVDDAENFGLLKSDDIGQDFPEEEPLLLDQRFLFNKHMKQHLKPFLRHSAPDLGLHEGQFQKRSFHASSGNWNSQEG